LLVGAIASGALAAPVKVLPLGDSITFGCGDGCNGGGCEAQCGLTYDRGCMAGYRADLWRKLSPGSNISKDWVFLGSMENGPEDIDRHHESHPGWKIEGLEEVLDKSFIMGPDVILLHLGTNNMGVGLQSPNVALNHMDRMLDRIFAGLPNVRVLLSTLIGTRPIYGGWSHAEFNAGLRVMVRDGQDAGRNIELVDMPVETGLGENGDFSDYCVIGVHPNNKGYAKMADVWYTHLTGNSVVV